MRVDQLSEAWRERIRTAAIEPAATFTEAGLVLGAGTVLARRTTDRWGRPALAIDGDEERILALLAVAYGRAIEFGIIGHIRRASAHHAEGETCLALICLAHAGLRPLDDPKPHIGCSRPMRCLLTGSPRATC